MWTSLAAVIAAAVVTAPAPPARARAAAPSPAHARVVGKLVFRDRDRAVSPAEAQRRAGGKRIGLELRHGWDVVPARLEPDGRFVVDVAPGVWRIEWIDVGDGAEALARPLEIEARSGATACAGQIEIAYGDVQSELGANAAGTVTVEDRCAELGAAAALARVAEDDDSPRPGFTDVLAGIRVEGMSAAREPALRLSWVIPFRRPLSWRGGVFLLGAASRVFPTKGSGYEIVEAGGGFVPWSGFEVGGGARFASGGEGKVAPWAGVRWVGMAYALGARAIFAGGSVQWNVGLDLTPYYILGSFL